MLPSTLMAATTESSGQSPAGKFMEGIFAALAQFDNDVRGGRTKAGMQEALRRGQWIFRPPLGYLADGKSLRIWTSKPSWASPRGSP